MHWTRRTSFKKHRLSTDFRCTLKSHLNNSFANCSFWKGTILFVQESEPNCNWDIQGMKVNSHRIATDSVQQTGKREISKTPSCYKIPPVARIYLKSCFISKPWLFDISTAPICCQGDVSCTRRLRWGGQLSEVATVLWCHCQDMVDGEFDFWCLTSLGLKN